MRHLIELKLNLKKLEDTVVTLGCRDEVQTPSVLKTLSWSEWKLRRHKNGMSSFIIMSQEEQGTHDTLIRKVILKPKRVMLWSKNTINLHKKI